jgi:hypothetical protein
LSTGISESLKELSTLFKNIVENHKIEADNVLRINKLLQSEISSANSVKNTVHNDYLSLLTAHDILKSENLSSLKQFDEEIKKFENFENEKNNEMKIERKRSLDHNENEGVKKEKKNNEYNVLMKEFDAFKESTLDMVIFVC